MLPIIINTWAFTGATNDAWDALNNASSKTPALDAVVQGCRSCEQSQCDFTVGFGGSPDEEAETTLDAMIMDGETMNVGAVGALRHCKQAILAARRVLENTEHSLLVGLQATQFAVEMAVPLDNLTTEKSHSMWKDWQATECQPNFRSNVTPDPEKSCGPYRPRQLKGAPPQPRAPGPSWVSRKSHDTISVVAIDEDGRIAAGSSSNGANHKVPRRVGDASVAGGGAYAESGVGGCASTGDGDLHLRFLPCYQVVESMRQGSKPLRAAEDAIKRILRFHPSYVGAIVAVGRGGKHAGAAAGWDFEYAVRSPASDSVEVVKVAPIGRKNSAASFFFA